MTTSINNTTQPVSFIRFHGMTLLVVENGGKHYVEAKPLNDLVGLNWRTTRPTITSGDNVILYGIRRLVPPSFNVLGSPSTPESASGSPSVDVSGIAGCPQTANLDGPSEGVLHILFERVQMFLARVNTSQMRVQGNVTGANYLLALQIEWAQALHSYETNGVARKNGHKEGLAELMGLYKVRSLAETPGERAALAALFRDSFEALGHPLPADPQQSLLES